MKWFVFVVIVSVSFACSQFEDGRREAGLHDTIPHNQTVCSKCHKEIKN